MKILILSLFISFQIFAQHPLLTLFDTGFIYVQIEQSNFSAGLDNYAANAGTWSGNVDGIWGVDDVLRGYGHLNARFYKTGANFDVAGGFGLGKRYRVTFDYYRTGISVTPFQFSEWDAASYTTFLSIPQTSPQIVEDEWATIDTSFVFTFTNATEGSGLRIYANPQTLTDTVYIKNIKIYEVR